VRILAEPKRFGRRKAAPAPPLRELGDDRVSGKPMVVKDGRFGPYVTDGETNASLRKGDTVDGITPERAMELLQIRREAGPTKRGRKKAAAKKATAKRTAKKATKKRAAKKAKPAKAAAKKAAADTAGGAAADQTAVAQHAASGEDDAAEQADG
jgi:DNA topoisomerase I